MAKNTASKAKEIKIIEEVERPKCVMCGGTYPKQTGYFPRSYSPLWFGNGYYAPICKNCIIKLFKYYMVELNDVQLAFERVCMKLDFYYHPNMYKSIFEQGGVDGIWGEYYKQINHTQWGTGKYTYDTTLEKRAQGDDTPEENDIDVFDEIEKEKESDQELADSQESIDFWGDEYTPSEHKQLNDDYTSLLIQANNGEPPSKPLELTLKDICTITIDLKRARKSGTAKPQDIASLQTTRMKLFEQAGLKPNPDDGNSLAAKNALGVLIDVWENTEPVPKYPEENKLKQYIDIWFKGHLARAAGIKNDTQGDYDAEIEKYKVKILGDGEEDVESIESDDIDSGETDV